MSSVIYARDVSQAGSMWPLKASSVKDSWKILSNRLGSGYWANKPRSHCSNKGERLSQADPLGHGFRRCEMACRDIPSLLLRPYWSAVT